MTRDDAVDVVALINATWPADPIPDEDSGVWLATLWWRDFELAVECITAGPWPSRPTLSEFDDAYRRPPIERLRKRLLHSTWGGGEGKVQPGRAPDLGVRVSLPEVREGRWGVLPPASRGSSQ